VKVVTGFKIAGQRAAPRSREMPRAASITAAPSFLLSDLKTLLETVNPLADC
jgi:hypothetical protein